MECGFNACGPNFNYAISGSCRTRTDCPQAAHLIGQSPVKLGSSDSPIRVAYGRFPKTLPVSAVVFSHHNRGALDVRNYRMGSV